MAFRFVDLFAGIGGFHQVMNDLDGRCVFASEIDRHAAEVYERNWGIRPEGDIVPLTEGTVQIPPHDVLCAGFPCQPFSKSGHQRGINETRGTLFWNICRVLEERKPSIVVLENVRNLAGPRHADTWRTIVQSLRLLGYAVPSRPTVFSPHWLPPSAGGTPQNRERVFIVGVHVGPELASNDLADIPVPVRAGPVAGWDPWQWDLASDLPLECDDAIHNLDRYLLTAEEQQWIAVWDDFLQSVDCERLPGFPIWADAFVADPHITPDTPRWKANFLEKNSAFYLEHRAQIDRWLRRHGSLTDLPPSRRKLEWQAQDTERSLRNCVLHFRPSGIRAKQATYLPALVAITQTSVLGPRGRRITPREAARLQGLSDDFDFGTQTNSLTYKQLGNGVAVGAVRHVFLAALAQMREHLPPHLRGVAERHVAETPLPLSLVAA